MYLTGCEAQMFPESLNSGPVVKKHLAARALQCFHRRAEAAEINLSLQPSKVSRPSRQHPVLSLIYENTSVFSD